MNEQTLSRASSSDETLVTLNDHVSERDPNPRNSSRLSKIEQNREAQRQFRLRRKEYIRRLEKQVLAIQSLESEARILSHKNREMAYLLDNQKSLFQNEREQWIRERMELYKVIQHLQSQVCAPTKDAMNLGNGSSRPLGK